MRTVTRWIVVGLASLGVTLALAGQAGAIPVQTDSTLIGAVAYVKAAAEHQWYQGIVDEQAAQARAAASRMPSGGGYHGPHSDAWWSGVAQCEQGGRNDPYFGYFSFMNGSQGGRPWADQVAAGNALLASTGKEVGTWAASCVQAGYNASPGG